MIPGCHATAELATHRRAAVWLALAISLALQWAAPHAVALNSIFASAERTVAAAISTPAALAHGPLEPVVIESSEAEQELAGLTVAELSDEFLVAPRSMQPAEHGSSIAAGAIYADPCAAFPRAFHPRGPPRTA